MKHCDYCNVDVDENTEFCPLCYADLTENDKKGSPEFFSHTVPLQKAKKSLNALKILVFISIIIATICVFLNIKNGGPLWSVIVILSIGYLWLLVMHTIISHDTPFKKVMAQVIWVVGFLLAIDKIFTSFDWLTNYAFPGVCLLALVFMIFFAGCSKNRENFILSFFIIFVFMIIASTILICTKIDKFQTLNQINIIAQSLACLSFVLFCWTPLKNEAIKKFHL